MSADERSLAAVDRHLQDIGVSYRVYGEARERNWPMSRLPLLIEEEEWTAIAAGITQRAGLIETMLADVYGPGELVRDGVIPAALIAGSSEFVRPLAGVSPPGGRWLRFYAADLGRGPDGRWWVLSDRAQAPSGLGYALENRLVMSRALPTGYRRMNVCRLAPFFSDFRSALVEAAAGAEPRVCLLTPGPYSQTYFEQAYLARYLGFLLVEGEDLVVHDAMTHVRTIAGPKRADAIWRFVDSNYVDPIELNGQSRLGVPGLMSALRHGGTLVANMPGCGIAESRAMMSIMPSLASKLIGQKLALPNIATWWCGDPRSKRHVLDNFDEMAISGALFGQMSLLQGELSTVPGMLDEAGRAELREAVERRGMDYVGQEVVQLSTTPVREGDKLVPRPFVLRVFAAATENGWEIMPGGFCRISADTDARAISMGVGVQSADVWVLSSKPVAPESLLSVGDNVHIQRVSAIFQAARRTICIGTAAIWSAPKRRCVLSGACACAASIWMFCRATYRRRSRSSHTCSWPGARSRRNKRAARLWRLPGTLSPTTAHTAPVSPASVLPAAPVRSSVNGFPSTLRGFPVRSTRISRASMRCRAKWMCWTPRTRRLRGSPRFLASPRRA
ncbi:hypothetical protein AUC70_06195 [Methyloceanibacter stevinii]|uniref:Circularly permuted ATP-grasp type 2 domain-containing protein n=1 Tax=Methyloceanibacter stevinii TaxID=1774970 RepID=A0A1E3VP06_9HYPH|nr:hypothetical protein AUC70_06195 [Methyloceanibacter stevinii]